MDLLEDHQPIIPHQRTKVLGLFAIRSVREEEIERRVMLLQRILYSIKRTPLEIQMLEVKVGTTLIKLTDLGNIIETLQNLQITELKEMENVERRNTLNLLQLLITY